jgi:anti-sigma factor ChrR (cupin superfamily)
MTPAAAPIVIRDLLQRAAVLRDEPGWEPFRQGIRIRRLYQVGEEGPAAALLRYEPNTAVPAHVHLGYEHILILDGAQSDENGVYPAGTFLVNRPQSIHRVSSATGCVVLIIWEKGIHILDSTQTLNQES